MTWTQIKPYVSMTGEWLATLTHWVVKQISSFGLNITPVGAKIINIIFLIIGVYLIISFLQNAKPLLKYGLLILLLVLVISTIISFGT